MDRTARYFCLLTIIFMFLYGGMQMVDGTVFDSIGFGGQVTLYPDNNITNISLYAPSPNATTNTVWFDATPGQVQIRINLNATTGKTYWVDFYNRTGGGYTKINAYSSGQIVNPQTYSVVWTGLTHSSVYNWSVNVTCNATGEYLNQSGFYSFTSPEPLVVFDSVGFGGEVNLSVGQVWGSVFDSVGFGGVVNLTVPGGGNWSNFSGYWEFYKRTTLYDLNIDGTVNVGDRTKVWANRDAIAAFNYYYDVNDDSTVNVGDRTAVWGNID